MTDIIGPFDGTPWAEAQWGRHAGVWAPSAVYGAPAASSTAGDLPLSLSALTAGVGAGRAWVRGFGFERSGAAVMQAVTANTHASFSRRDRIVLRRNLASHTVSPVLLTGTPAGTPAAPALTQSEGGSWDLPLFSFLVPPNSGTSITGIIDERAWLDPATGLLNFATVAARDAYFVTPADGSLCFTADAGFWRRASGAWLSTWRDTGWQTFAPTNGWTPVTTNGSPGLRYRVINDTCYLSFELNGNVNWTAGVVVFTMPAGARPSTAVFVRTTKDATNGVDSGQLRIGTDGAATLNIAGSGGNDIYATTSFLIN